MRDGKIGGKQLMFLIMLSAVGNSLLNYGGTSKQDAWIASAAAWLIMLPLLLMYLRIMKLGGGWGLYGIIYLRFGRAAGFVISFIYIIYAVLILIMIFGDFIEFLKTVMLPSTSPFFLIIPIIIACIYILRAGPHALGRCAVTCFIFAAAVLLLSNIASMPFMKIDNLKPVLSAPPANIADDAFNMSVYPYGGMIFLLAFFPYLKTGRSTGKFVTLAYLLSGIILTLVILRNILMLGGEAQSALYFPTYTADGLIELKTFIRRIEPMLSGVAIVFTIFKLCAAIFFAAKGFESLLGPERSGGAGEGTPAEKWRAFIAPITILCGAAGILLFKNIAGIQNFSKNFRYFALPVIIIIPIIIWLLSEVANIRNKKINKFIKVTEN